MFRLKLLANKFVSRISLIVGNKWYSSRAIIDTGAEVSLFTNKELRFSSEQLHRDGTILKAVSLSNHKCTYYKVYVDTLCIGNIELKQNYIYVTEDNVSYNVIGMDILSKLNFSYEAAKGELCISKPVKEDTLTALESLKE